MKTHMRCGKESIMFQGPNSNKTINIIVADGGFVINYYSLIKPIDQAASIDLTTVGPRYQMKTIVTTTIKDLNESIGELCLKVQSEGND